MKNGHGHPNHKKWLLDFINNTSDIEYYVCFCSECDRMIAFPMILCEKCFKEMIV